ncbi:MULTISPECIES: glycosyltransferase [unclassified Streptomyces]|uniref:glycosyltransferase n=1 Tax=unclassified Streptomyces TaxID=2593676 RepID=UPI003807C872
MAVPVRVPARPTPEPAAASSPDPDPLVAARTAFYTASRARSTGRPPSRHPGGDPAGCDPAGEDLARLLEAEYGPCPRTAPAHQGPGLAREDATTASLRQACRLGVPLTPDALLAHADGGPRLTAVLAEMWPETVRRHGADYAEETLRGLLRARPRAFLVDLAEAAGLRPLDAAEAAVRAARADRPERHALWRHLRGLPDGPRHLPDPATARDPYERLLLSPPPPLTDVPLTGDGLLAAQSMLLGGLDTPGQGLSGGLSVLLGGFGDGLAATEGVAGVITVVAAGHDDLTDGAPLARERAPGHWVLRLPVDTPGVLHQDEMHAHRPALAWWAIRLLGSLPRPVDVVHVRYADDGSLALAQAADRLGAGLAFTATPDPHRRLAARRDGGEALREDLHRVFLADRLVDRADTVVGIPGPGGTRDLLRHFPALTARYGDDGPAAPPEGIAPYVPHTDEERQRTALLDALFGGGDRPDALAPEDRALPLLLCVGRLHPVKQQDLLVRAWLAAGLWRVSTLVLVGGGDTRPTAAEQHLRATVRALLADRPEAARRLALLPALPNDRVRRLERALADPARGTRAWYVCPSAKEEFGLAVIEAMEAGLPAAGPRNGGVPHYLSDGGNGLLLDTASLPALARGLRRLLSVPEPGRARLARAGRETVTARFSVAEMARALADEYAGIRAAAAPARPVD